MSMTKRNFEMTTEQMEQILDVAPDGAEYFVIATSLYYRQSPDLAYLEWRHATNTNWQHSGHPDFEALTNNWPENLKLSDIRAELNEREDKRLAQEVKDKLDALTYYPKVCLSDSAKNDTQSDLSIKNGSQSNSHQIASDCNLTSEGAESGGSSVSDEKKLKPCQFCGGDAEIIWGETHEQATERAVACNQCHAQTQWVYSTQEAIEAWNTRAEQSVIERVHAAYADIKHLTETYVPDERYGLEQALEVLEAKFPELKEVAGNE